jgi:hypothetical protein
MSQLRVRTRLSSYSNILRSVELFLFPFRIQLRGEGGSTIPAGQRSPIIVFLSVQLLQIKISGHRTVLQPSGVSGQTHCRLLSHDITTRQHSARLWVLWCISFVSRRCISCWGSLKRDVVLWIRDTERFFVSYFRLKELRKATSWNISSCVRREGYWKNVHRGF